MKRTLLMGLFLMSCCLLQAQAAISLKLQKGSTYCLSTNNKITVIQTVNGKEQQTTNNEKRSFCYKVLEELDSLYLVETYFTHLSQQVASPESSEAFNSDKPDTGNMMSTILSRILKKSFLVWMRNDYAWKETRGLDSIFLHAFDDYNLPPETKKPLDSLMLVMVKDFTRNHADLTAVLYSSKKVVPGDVWTTSTYAEHVIPTLDSCTYHLAENGSDLLLLTGTGVTTSTGDESREGDELTKYDLKGTSKVTVTFFKNSGWIKQGNLTTELSGNTRIRNIKTRVSYQVPTKIITESVMEGQIHYGAISQD